MALLEEDMTILFNRKTALRRGAASARFGALVNQRIGADREANLESFERGLVLSDYQLDQMRDRILAPVAS